MVSCSVWHPYYPLPPPQPKKKRRSYNLCFMRYKGREVPESNISLFSQKQHFFPKNIIRTKIFCVKFSIKMISTKFFSSLTVTKLQGFKVGSYVYIVHKYSNEWTLSIFLFLFFSTCQPFSSIVTLTRRSTDHVDPGKGRVRVLKLAFFLQLAFFHNI